MRAAQLERSTGTGGFVFRAQVPATVKIVPARQPAPPVLVAPRPVRIIVTGWRDADASHEDEIEQWMARAVAFVRPLPDYSITDPSTITIVDGACHRGGVDDLAYLIAVRRGYSVERHPAQGHPTEDFGPWPGCGPRRNQYMCGLGADLVLAFPGPGSKGTWNCLQEAYRYHIDSMVHGLYVNYVE